MKKHFIEFCVVSFLSVIALSSYSQPLFSSENNLQKMNNTHDLTSLSPWGPYSNRYAGISHIPDMKSGMRYDFFVVPGYYQRKALIPNVRYESDYYPWNVSNNYSFITYRYELEWKDKVYADVTYFNIDTCTVLIKADYVNNSDMDQSLSMNLLSNINYPANYPKFKINNPESDEWHNALQYKILEHKIKRFDDYLVYDGCLRDEVRNNEFIDGRIIGKNFGKDAGDFVTYNINIKPDKLTGKIVFLYRADKGKNMPFRFTGLEEDKIINFKGTGEFESLAIDYNVATPGDKEIRLVSKEGPGLDLNGFLISNVSSSIRIVPQEKSYTPEITENNNEKCLTMKYKDASPYYGITWDADSSFIRGVANDELDNFFKEKIPDRFTKIWRGNNLGYYVNVYIRPISMKPKTSKTFYALICNGDKSSVESSLKRLENLKSTVKEESTDNLYEAGELGPGASQYILGQKIMQATLLTNIIYPTYTQDSFIRHYSPGKWFDMLYTWDGGFINLGLNEINKQIATEYLNTYTTPKNSQSAFIEHGTPLPVQIYALQDLYNKTQSKELLEYFYPRVKKYYDFISGKYENSTTHKLKSNLLETWDYFYNSGGWDDYPPQKHLDANPTLKDVTPVITTAQAIREAKILRMMAVELNKKEDIKVYDKDINDFSKAIQKYTWDKNVGYFSYMEHDKDGSPTHFFIDPVSGKNYNMGLDGAYPLLSGICSPQQEEILLDKIFSPTHMWTNFGISVVDQSAPYFRNDGYWNGAVWMAHQWFMWKTMLDLNHPDLANKIAKTGLDTWKRETDESYHTYEHFQIDNGRGAGLYQFGGLSSPVIPWFNAYYKIGTITTGFEIMVNEFAFNKDNSSLKATLSFDNATAAHQRSILLCMNPQNKYKVFFNNKAVNVKEENKGLLVIQLPATNKKGVLEISAL